MGLYSKIIVIPDSHDEPGVEQSRFTLANKLIRAEKPDYVVHLGDHFDTQSLGKYDKGKAHGEGVRLTEELASGRKALDLICNRAKGVKWVFLEGNHENRANDYANDNPELVGLVGSHMFPLDGWQQVPFLKPIELEGVWFSHYFPSGVMNRPIGGINPGQAVLRKHKRSAVWGHSHEFHYATEGNALDGQVVHALNAGCFFEQWHGFAGPANRLYRRGIAILHNVCDGDFDLEWVSIDRLREKYD